jgi:hypothetical protein
MMEAAGPKQRPRQYSVHKLLRGVDQVRMGWLSSSPEDKRVRVDRFAVGKLDFALEQIFYGEFDGGRKRVSIKIVAE